MPTKMFFDAEGCKGATLASGRSFDADRQGLIHVEDSHDVAALKAGGYMVAGGMPKLRKFWVCDDCAWDASINSCGKCGSTSLRKVER
jgi:hypothetical protein